ncbi:MAG: tRNA threonylcarbamoyladenosine dehydratase [Eubacterium sp.]|nr:tRNA threonylcarbamoyladenosine dehydratase [Eubacterium sp.]
MQEALSRTEMLIGSKALEKLAASRVAVFGVGGVGGYVVEALARSGIGALDLIDRDTVSLSNLNRQIIATRDTLGAYKVDAAEERVLSINPDVKVHKHCCFYLPENHGDIRFEDYDYVVDAVDTVTAKLDIITEAQKLGIPVISAMGCGNRLDPSLLQVTDIYKTEQDPLARVMRRECRKRGVKRLKVVYSTEPAIKPLTKVDASGDAGRKDTPGSAVFVPAAAGLLIASAVCRDIIGPCIDQ